MKAAVLTKIGEPLEIKELAFTAGGVENLLPGHVVVHMICSGICGAQLQEIDGVKGDPSHIPHLLGHEGCGRVLGSNQKVIVHWRKGEGRDPDPVTFGEIKAGPCTTFSEFTVVSENRITPIPDDVPDDFAALLGCSLSTALSLIEKEAQPRHGDSVLIVGCGGLGLALILALKIRQNCKIHAVDIAKGKKDLVESLGAKFSHRFNKRNWLKPFEIVIDTVGDEATKSWVRTGGKYISLQAGGTEGGGFNPDSDIPRYIDMWRCGMLDDYTKLITHRFPLDKINDGIELMRQGKAGRVMIDL